VSLVAAPTRIVPRPHAGAEAEGGRRVVCAAGDGGIRGPAGCRCAVREDKTAEQGQLTPAWEHHQQVVDRPPWVGTGDRGVQAPETGWVAGETR
jgi:hypothetical protein